MQLVNQLIGVVNQVAFLIILVLVRGHVHIDTSVIYQREGIRAVIVIDQGVGVAQQLGNGIVLGFLPEEWRLWHCSTLNAASTPSAVT